MSKTTQRVTTAVFCAFLALLGILHLVLPDRTFSPVENRNLRQVPAFTWRALREGSYTAALETYLEDQFPLRDQWTGLKARTEQILGKREFNGVYLCGGALMGLGLGMVFSQGATTGGTDIIGRLLKLKFPWLPLGKLVLAPDLAALVLVAIAFGRLEAALYGAVAMFVSSQVTDTVLYGLDSSKVAYIISDNWQEITRTLMDRQGRGVTILQGEGGYTGDEKRVLLVAFKQREIVDIKRQVHELDGGAFLIVCDARDVLGEGFGEYRQDEI